MATIHEATLNDFQLACLRDRIEKLNKRAARLGMQTLVLNVKETRVTTRRDEITFIEYDVRLHDVELTGCAPKIDGWQVAAKIEFTEAGNLVHLAPGVENADPAWRSCGNHCEHCGTKRNRNDLVVLRHDDGRQKIVGRNCLADYLRTGDAETLLEWASYTDRDAFAAGDIDADYDKWVRFGRFKPVSSVRSVLMAASICIRKMGWTSGSAAWENQTNSTKADVAKLLWSRKDCYWEKWVKEYGLYMNEHDAKEADAAIEWLDSLDKETANDYLYNLCIIRDLGWVDADKLGYAVSILVAAKRARDEELKRKENGPKRFFDGEIKQRVRKQHVRIKRIRSIDGMYGVTTIITMALANDSAVELTWFASGDKTEEFAEGAEYIVDFTIKDFDDNERFGKTTKVNRCTVKEELTTAA